MTDAAAAPATSNNTDKAAAAVANAVVGAAISTIANEPTTPAAVPADAATAKEKVQQRNAAEEKVGELAPPPTKDEARKFAREFLLGELIKAVKCHFITLAKPFTQLKEHEQETLLRRVQSTLESAVKEAIETIAADARLTFRAEVDSVTFKDGVKAALKLAKSEHAHVLADQAGKSVLVVVEDFAKFMNPGDEAKGEPDQKPLFDASRKEAEKVASDNDKAQKPPRSHKKKVTPKGNKKAAKKR